MFNEQEIIQRVLRGDLRSYELLVRQYEKLVFLVISRLVDQREDAEDICQEVFLKVYKHLGSFAFQSKLSTWIARIAYLTTINHLKKSRPGKPANKEVEIEDLELTPDDPETLLIKKNTSERVNEMIAALPLQYRTVITLFHLKEFSYQEIEVITGMPEGTVKSYLFRARKLLKDKLQTL